MGIERRFRPPMFAVEGFSSIKPGINRPKGPDGAIVYGNGIIGPSDKDKVFFNEDHTMSDEQRKKRHIDKKLLLSGLLGAGIFTANWVGASAFAWKESIWAYSHLPKNVNSESLLVFIYGAHIGVSILDKIQEGRLLKNSQIELSQDFPATFTYRSLGKIKTLEKKKVKRSVAAVLTSVGLSLLWTIPRESTFISLALLSDDNMQKLFALKSGQVFLYLLQIGGAEIALRTVGREKKTKPASQQGEQNLPPSGTIIDMKRD